MHSYRPDWLGAILAGVFVGLSILVTTRMFPRKTSIMVTNILKNPVSGFW